MKHNRIMLISFLTPIFFVLCTWVSALPHEYAHSVTAWILGFKQHPFAIQYGHLTWKNIFFLSDIDEKVNYYLIYLLGFQNQIGIIAFAGPGIATVSIYLFSLTLLRRKYIQHYPILFYFIFWITLFNLAELVSYVFLRSFSAHGDLGHIEFSWHISPWWIFTVGGILLIIAVWHFFTKIILDAYKYLSLESTSSKIFLLALSTFILFGHPGLRMFLGSYGPLTTFLAILACLTMPIVIIICWPTREWVKQLNSLNH